MKKAWQFCRKREQLQSWVVWNEPEMEQQDERPHHSRMHGILQAPFEVCLHVTALNALSVSVDSAKKQCHDSAQSKGSS
jgi:hypothetical protein